LRSQVLPLTNQKLYGLDHLRAFAISYVLLFHIRIFGHPAWTEAVGKFGWTGVDLFFVLSGYLISSQLFATLRAGKQISFPEFFVKRFFRIIPAYLTVVAIYFCFPFFREKEALPPLWKFLTFTQNYHLDLRSTGTFSHAWSLCIEEQFYLALPLLLMALFYFNKMKKGFYLLLFLFAAGFGVRAASWHFLVEPLAGTDDFWTSWYRYIYYPLHTRLDGLLAGVALAALLTFRPQVCEKIARYGNILLLAGFLILAGAYGVCQDQYSLAGTVLGFPLVAVGYGFLVWGAVTPSSFLYRMPSRISSSLATLSYAIYLSHKGVIHMIQTGLSGRGMPADSNGMLLISLAGCLAGALLLRVLVEKPFLHIRKLVLSYFSTKSLRLLPVR
jgi:peptidoglycan/LPS O-acetylase OafA/YrhL